MIRREGFTREGAYPSLINTGTPWLQQKIGDEGSPIT